MIRMMAYDWPRRDTVRSKRKLIRKINRVVRKMNRSLRNDVFKDRFSVVVLNKDIRPYSDHSGWDAHFLIEFRDEAQPNRNYAYWFEPHFIIYSGFFAGGRHVDTDLNDFIVRSDFWETYRR